jgi:hypothetical protein
MIEIFGRVLLDLVLFQEAVELEPRRHAQENAELVAGEPALAIRFNADRL